MKKLCFACVLAWLLSVAGHAAESASTGLPELRGVLATGAERRFALATPGTGQTAWVTVGDTFAGWKLAAYRPSEDALVLVQDGHEMLLKLSSGQVGVTQEKATLADAEAVLTKMKFEEMFGKIFEQQKKGMAPTMKQMMGNLKGVDAAEAEAFQKKMMDTMYSGMKAEEMRGDIARIYSEVFTKNELQNLSDFYGTATGQALIDKQPAIQQKMMEIMMPRMMAGVGKAQQIAADFAKQQAAKKAAAATAP
ncbi:MAG: DUF2059 domain-containing protein [Verrucomicrobia bacterium]|nr:DUF2059 domain-containing protein [Verrucomicrobiota bacterium]